MSPFACVPPAPSWVCERHRHWAEIFSDVSATSPSGDSPTARGT